MATKTTRTKAPVRKTRKFGGGGSVMDTPSRDMRDPAYRKQLEKEQALETSTDDLELLLGVGAARKGIGFLAKDFKNVTQRAPSRSITKNIEIGSRTPETIYKKEYDRLFRMGQDVLKETGRKVPEEDIRKQAKYWTEYELKKQRKPSSFEKEERGLSDKLKKTAKQSLLTGSIELAPKAAKRLTSNEEEPSPMRKGGLAQKAKQTKSRAKTTSAKKKVVVSKLRAKQRRAR